MARIGCVRFDFSLITEAIRLKTKLPFHIVTTVTMQMIAHLMDFHLRCKSTQAQYSNMLRLWLG